MATEAQIEFFNKLTTERDFGRQDIEKLRAQFANLPDKSASAWIERSLELPEADAVAPPF